MADKGKLFDRAMVGAGLPGEAIPGLPLVEVVGRRRLLIENHLGVICYAEEEIRVKTRLGCICITGQRMTLAQMSKSRLVITGMIDNISFL